MLNKWKDKAIKALGGYTEDEMQKQESLIWGLRMQRNELLCERPRRLRLGASYKVPKHFEQYASKAIIENALARLLAEEIQPYITMTKADNGDEWEYKGIIEVLIPEEKEKEEAQK